MKNRKILAMTTEIHYTTFDSRNLTFPHEPKLKSIPGNDSQKYLSDEMMYIVQETDGTRNQIQTNIRLPRSTWRVFKNVDNNGKVSYSAVTNLDVNIPEQKQVLQILNGVHQASAVRLATNPNYADLFGPDDNTPDLKYQFALRDTTIKGLVRYRRDKATKQIVPGSKPSLWAKMKPGSTVLVSLSGQPLNDWDKLANTTLDIDGPLICCTGIYKGSVRSEQCQLVSGLVVSKIDRVNVDKEKEMAKKFREEHPELYEKNMKSLEDIADSASSSQSSSSTPMQLVTQPAPIPGLIPAVGMDTLAAFTAGLSPMSLPSRQ